MASSCRWVKRLRSVRFGRYWRKRPLVFSLESPLPRATGIAEVDLDARVDRELNVLEHLLALVPGKRAAQLLRQLPDRARERVADRRRCVAVGEGDELQVARLALDQRRDPGRPSAQEEVPLPVARDRAVRGLGRALADHHLVRDLTLPLVFCALRRRAAKAPAAAQVVAELAPERPARLDEKREVDRLVGDPHPPIIAVAAAKPGGDLLRRPSCGEAARRPPPAEARLPRAWTALGGAPAATPRPRPTGRGSGGDRRCGAVPKAGGNGGGRSLRFDLTSRS